MSGRDTFWHCPPWSQLIYAIGLGLAVFAWFGAIYGGAAYLTDRHDYRVRLDIPADLAMPLVPAMSVVYLSLNGMLWCAPFILRSRRELVAMAAALAVATVIAGIGFVLLPAADAFPPPSDEQLGAWGGVYRFARWLALRNNYFPSLHIAFTTISVMIYWRWARATGKLLLAAWGIAIVASTLLTHQHYLSDAAAGLLLGWVVVIWVYRPLTATAAAAATREGETPRASPSPSQVRRA